ncbi:MAG: SAM-dependent methyltransferase, partial [Nitrospinaceae bacterium]|nr:SAM-dependent methyltransferase [Nitrospinaceae bacterium]NIR53325.1 SAM-dependent methyltransferase [Nitrospinaceae bacterium]NIS83723.1 SAM-dependent methyltransferase [Nitrospinaceae bacterium]NIU42847.1 SAM-dependent methyltransferase [Nitrospinaceae bacterium]NIU94919.1 SAM-dependent methyltransferase [Nitrospinaceae bacterium]
LMRLFSVIQWHHFAYMIISLALLGYGASGTFLAFARHRLLRHFPTAFFLNLALFGVSSVACYFLAQKIPFNPQEVLWDARQPLMLFGIYLLLALPFFFVANSIGLALTGYRKETSKIYAADLIGAGGGALGIILLLFWVFPMKALLILGVLGLLAAVASLWELGWRRKGWALAMAAMALLPLLLPGHWPQPNLSPYKALSQTLRVSGTQIVEERSSPLGWVAVVESSRVPFRHAPGLSLNARTVPPRQKGLFTDGGS